MQTKSCIIGIDFGTTSLSAVIINVDNIGIEKVFSYTTDAYISFPESYRKEQSIEKLTPLFLRLLEEINAIQDINILAYGFTGQMHGIIGLNNKKEAVTNLVTWQDRSGDIVLPNGKTLLEEIKELTDAEALANGYGIVTLYKWLNYDKRTDIDSFCTVADYFAMMLTDNKNEVVMSPTMAHSIGLFDVSTGKWLNECIKNLRLGVINFPNIKANSYTIGHTKSKSGYIPLICAIGDNQASFLGSVINKEKSILLNIGTGTQLSFLIRKDELSIYDKYIDGYETQVRPFDEDSYLLATSFVNGGSVYDSLFNFFHEVGVSLFNIENPDKGKLWKNMEKIGRENLNTENPLLVSPLLEGQRKDPTTKGSITNLATDNFQPGNLISGFLVSLANYYKTGYFPELKSKVKYICGSGNGLKRNSLFSEIIEKTFGHPLYLTTYNEEAAVGSAINAAIAIGIIKDEAENCSFLAELSQDTLITA